MSLFTDGDQTELCGPLFTSLSLWPNVWLCPGCWHYGPISSATKLTLGNHVLKTLLILLLFHTVLGDVWLVWGKVSLCSEPILELATKHTLASNSWQPFCLSLLVRKLKCELFLLHVAHFRNALKATYSSKMLEGNVMQRWACFPSLFNSFLVLLSSIQEERDWVCWKCSKAPHQCAKLMAGNCLILLMPKPSWGNRRHLQTFDTGKTSNAFPRKVGKKEKVRFWEVFRSLAKVIEREQSSWHGNVYPWQTNSVSQMLKFVYLFKRPQDVHEEHYLNSHIQAVSKWIFPLPHCLLICVIFSRHSHMYNIK